MKLKTASQAMIRTPEEQMVRTGDQVMPVRVIREMRATGVSITSEGLAIGGVVEKEDLALMDPKLAAAKASEAYPDSLQAHLFKRHPNT